MKKRNTILKFRQAPVSIASIEKRIYLIRGQRVMLDSDLAELYRTPTHRLNEQLKRNLNRFPKDFMFQLNQKETGSLTSQFAISKAGRGGRRTLPYAFTEQGVAMLSSVLSSDRAVQVNIAIMRAFVKLREIIATHTELAQKIQELEDKFEHHDSQIQAVFSAIRDLLKPPPLVPKRRIGFSGTA